MKAAFAVESGNGSLTIVQMADAARPASQSIPSSKAVTLRPELTK
jgi:hypothetical protein